MMTIDRMQTCNTLNRQLNLAQQSERYLFKEATVYKYSAYYLQELLGLFRSRLSLFRRSNMDPMQAYNVINR